MDQTVGNIQVFEAANNGVSLAEYNRMMSFSNCLPNPGYNSCVLSKGSGREEDQCGVSNTVSVPWEGDRIAQNGSSQFVGGFTTDNNGCCCAYPSSSFLAADIAGRMQRELQELDFVVLMQMEKTRRELELKRRKHWAGVLAAAERWAEAVLRPKEAELDGFRRRNAALEERVQQLTAENQAWQALAQTNEAEVVALERELKAAQEMEGTGDSRQVPEEASSCHCEGEIKAAVGKDGGSWDQRWWCRSCRQKEATVLLLPCRHLCVCPDCDAVCGNCPVRAGDKTASLHVCFA